MQRIDIDGFLELALKYPVFDVRSPGEYAHAHIPGAYSLPLFSDEERKVVGTLYKEKGKEQAIKQGLDFFGVKMRVMVEEVERTVRDFQLQTGATANCILVHCWRGGMRSAGVAWLLDLYGFKVYTLAGGYKSFRNWVLKRFEQQYPLKIIGGYTGSGKTQVLKELAKSGQAVLDLEGIAHHKGSAFGSLGEEKQPSQEMFENILGRRLSAIGESKDIWVEDESRRIGNLNLPESFWKTMNESPVYFLDVPFEERLTYITAEYGKYKREELVNSIMRIRKRLGGLNAKNAIGYLVEDNVKECFRVLLEYYDKYYKKSLELKSGSVPVLSVLNCGQVDAKTNSKMLSDYERPESEGVQYVSRSGNKPMDQ